MFHVLKSARYVYYCVVLYVFDVHLCGILITITYLLTYLLTYYHCHYHRHRRRH